MGPSAKLLFDYLRAVIYDPDHASLEIEALSPDYQELGKGILYFGSCVLESTTLAKSLAKGHLDVPLPPMQNEIAAPMKDLHAKLKHLTWQAQRVTQGDYRQRIDFMGEFSEAFNVMTEQLAQQRADLLEQIESGRRKTRDLEQTNSLLEALTGKISQWIIVMRREDSAWLFVNQQTGAVLKDPNCEKDLRAWMGAESQAMCGNGHPYSTELCLRGAVGNQYFSVEVYPLNWSAQSALAFMLTDISQDKQYLDDLQNTAYTDSLTQLYNRRYGMQALETWLCGSEPFILCFVDMDNLKYINDKFGHSEGDVYILAVAQILRDFAPGEAVLCRLGGDEFMLLIRGWSAEAARARMEALRSALLARMDLKGDPAYHGISYGIVTAEPRGTAACDLLSLADERMYAYKRAYKEKIGIKARPR